MEKVFFLIIEISKLKVTSCIFNFLSQVHQQSSRRLSLVKDDFAKGTINITDSFIYLGIALFILVCLVLLINWFLNRKKQLMVIKGWHEETNREVILYSLALAINSRAEYLMEIHNPNYSESYRGRLLSYDDNNLVLSLSSYQNVDLDFQEQNASVNISFKRNYEAGIEQYHFNTKTKGCLYHQEENWQEPAVLVGFPNKLVTTQRRRFIHIEPVADYHFSLGFYTLPTKSNYELNKQINLLNGSIDDISIGGFRCTVELVRKQKMVLAVNDQVMVKFILPTKNLVLTLKSKQIVAKAKILAINPFYSGVDFEEDFNKKIIRACFVGRYISTDISDLDYNYLKFDALSFQDLAYWIQAYQRYEIQKEKGTMSHKVEL